MLEVILSVLVSLVVMVGVAAVSLWIVKACDSCNHSYERIDDANDKKMILVCRKCGKIKKLNK